MKNLPTRTFPLYRKVKGVAGSSEKSVEKQAIRKCAPAVARFYARAKSNIVGGFTGVCVNINSIALVLLSLQPSQGTRNSSLGICNSTIYNSSKCSSTRRGLVLEHGMDGYCRCSCTPRASAPYSFFSCVSLSLALRAFHFFMAL